MLGLQFFPKILTPFLWEETVWPSHQPLRRSSLALIYVKSDDVAVAKSGAAATVMSIIPCGQPMGRIRKEKWPLMKGEPHARALIFSENFDTIFVRRNGMAKPSTATSELACIDLCEVWWCSSSEIESSGNRHVNYSMRSTDRTNTEGKGTIHEGRTPC